jgi:putative FmdB family regulatory protein
MPTYEYECRQCGEPLEVVQSFTDDALTTCPSCGGDLRKVFGNIGIVFKGSGFYKTDSRSGSSSSKAAADNGTSTTESKPETTKDSPTKSEKTSEKAPKSDKSDSKPAPSTPAKSPSSTKAAAAAS